MKNRKSTLENIKWTKLSQKSTKLIVGGSGFDGKGTDMVVEEITVVSEDLKRS